MSCSEVDYVATRWERLTSTHPLLPLTAAMNYSQYTCREDNNNDKSSPDSNCKDNRILLAIAAIFDICTRRDSIRVFVLISHAKLEKGEAHAGEGDPVSIETAECRGRGVVRDVGGWRQVEPVAWSQVGGGFASAGRGKQFTTGTAHMLVILLADHAT